MLNKQALLWSVILVVLLLLIFTPLVLVAVSLVMIPMVFLYVKQGSKSFVGYYVVSLLVVYLLTALFGAGVLGTIAAIYALFFLIPTIVMGQMYRRKATARSTITGGAVAMLAQLLVLLLVLTIAGIDVTDEMRQFVKNSMATVPAELSQMIPANLADQIIDMMIQLLPLYLIGISLYFSVVTHWLARRALLRSGESTPGLKPAREWMLPRSMVWYYLIALVLSFIFTEANGSMIGMILFNVIPLLMFAFAVQAIAFFFFIASVRGWSRAIPVIIAIVCALLVLIIPGFIQLLTLLGLFDIAFPIRSRMKKS
ncbi:MAG: YybS [Paenibacillus sp.]|nr:YybS [Paenibacillus sp.]